MKPADRVAIHEAM